MTGQVHTIECLQKGDTDSGEIQEEKSSAKLVWNNQEHQNLGLRF